MVWYVCFVLSILTLLVSIQNAVVISRNYKSGQNLNAFYIIFIGVFLSLAVAITPIFYLNLQGHSAFGLKLVMTVLIQTLQVFTVDSSSEFIFDNVVGAATPLAEGYSAYLAVLFFVAPIMTFGFVLSLFRNIFSFVRYITQYWSDVYVFSELSEKSLCLAKSIKKNHPKATIVFTNVDKDEGTVIAEYVDMAREIHAILFQKDIATVNLRRHSSKANMTFFAIDEDESENITNSLKLINIYADRDNTSLFVFSTSIEGEIVFSNCTPSKLKIRRINEIRSLIYNFLYNDGHQVFESGVGLDGKKTINAIILGLGRYGTEMLKALTWYCQMDGYEANIHAFDKDLEAGSRFAGLCPDVVSEKYNGIDVEGESRYNIKIHSGVDVRSGDFASEIEKIGAVTFVFVCLGSDSENIKQGANIRMLCERYGSNPLIKLVVYGTEKTNVLSGLTNYHGQPFNIDTMGDRETCYSEEVIMSSKLENLALARHMKWGSEQEFWKYEYNYRSSMASAIHLHARIACGVPGANKKTEDLTPSERDSLEILEHRRWNAYMRTEGYVYSGSLDSSTRNDLAKVHHNLVAFGKLNEADRRKDGDVGTL
ncbi:MAG: hypothetical protein MJ093_02995 [Saccharofermentans sp.]|nr:hypothetical protein [Saccharofermentans sp.]